MCVCVCVCVCVLTCVLSAILVLGLRCGLWASTANTSSVEESRLHPTTSASNCVLHVVSVCVYVVSVCCVIFKFGRGCRCVVIGQEMVSVGGGGISVIMWAKGQQGNEREGWIQQ